MSIIYDALQKTQKKRAPVMAAEKPVEKIIVSTPEKDTVSVHDNHFEWIDILLFITITCLVFAIIFLAQHKYKNYVNQKKIEQALLMKTKQNEFQIQLRNIYKKSHVLNGVFISSGDQVALINNKSFHLGDNVDGMKLVSLELNKVKLQNADSVLVLNVFAG
ncbi:MAG: hypothetical protein P4M12_06555 [Gammaproteobacteria bacterium]|nr:hypothetical protein [Gammaproteobacteria bacterium]